MTDTIIEELIDATCDDRRSQHLFYHALHSLVRMAKVEQLQEIRCDVALASGDVSQPVDCDSDSREST